MTAPALAAALGRAAADLEAELGALLPAAEGERARLAAAMRHAVLGGGKRLRGFLVLEGGRLTGAPASARRRVAAAIELLHAYSLVHDDLPAMDDATMRRGRPACHRAFDEATALLAGDALQALAFEVLAREDWPAPAGVRLRLLRELAAAAGAAGMCGGQMCDLEAQRRSLDEAGIREMQALKTGALIRFSCRAGAILAGAGERAIAALDDYGAALGLAFQISDDLLDLHGDAAETGKDVGRDAASGKATLVALLGEAEAKRRLAALREEAEAALARLPVDAILLRALFEFVIARRA